MPDIDRDPPADPRPDPRRKSSAVRLELVRVKPGSMQQAGAAETAGTQSVDLLAEPLAYSVADAALITGLSRDLVYDQMRLGKLDYLRVGRRRINTRQNLEVFLANARHERDRPRIAPPRRASISRRGSTGRRPVAAGPVRARSTSTSPKHL